MARIRHIALCSDNQNALASFYEHAFGLTEVFRHLDSEQKAAIYLSDGEMNLAIIPLIPTNDFRPGVDHFGFQIDESVEAVSNAAIAAGAKAGPTRVPRDGRQNEAYIYDPVGQRIDLAPAGWHLGAAGTARIRYIELAAADPATLANFYTSVFGLRFVTPEAGSVHLTDGHFDVAVLPARNGGRVGLNAFGLLVDDIASTTQRALAHGATTPTTHDADASAVAVASATLIDPDGTRIELSAGGWHR